MRDCIASSAITSSKGERSVGGCAVDCQRDSAGAAADTLTSPQRACGSNRQAGRIAINTWPLLPDRDLELPHSSLPRPITHGRGQVRQVAIAASVEIQKYGHQHHDAWCLEPPTRRERRPHWQAGVLAATARQRAFICVGVWGRA